MKRTAQKTREAPLIKEIMRRWGAVPNLMLWRNNVGVARPLNSNRAVRFGQPGAADIICVLRREVTITEVINPESFTPHERQRTVAFGQAIAIETKSSSGQQREKQIAWQAAWEDAGGLYCLARSVDDVVPYLGRGIDG